MKGTELLRATVLTVCLISRMYYSPVRVIRAREEWR
jgi:hypothetical protein